MELGTWEKYSVTASWGNKTFVVPVSISHQISPNLSQVAGLQTNKSLPRLRLRSIRAHRVSARLHNPVVPMSYRHVSNRRTESLLVDIPEIVRTLGFEV